MQDLHTRVGAQLAELAEKVGSVSFEIVNRSSQTWVASAFQPSSPHTGRDQMLSSGLFPCECHQISAIDAAARKLSAGNPESCCCMTTKQSRGRHNNYRNAACSHAIETSRRVDLTMRLNLGRED
jgi:hypothetical protein